MDDSYAEEVRRRRSYLLETVGRMPPRRALELAASVMERDHPAFTRLAEQIEQVAERKAIERR